MKNFTSLFAVMFCFVLLGTGQTDNTSQTGNSFRNSIPDQVKARKSFKRVEWFNSQRAWPYDTIPVIRYSNEMSREIKKTKGSKDEDLSWTSLGPTGVFYTGVPQWGIVGGRTKSIAIHPNDPLTLYIGTAHGGIWKTTDGGQNWQDIGYGLESLAFGAIALDPNNPETIYAGSGETCFFLGYIGFDGKGIFKSTDGGNSWTQITNGIGNVTSFGDLIVSPFNSNVLLGALASGNYYSGNLPNEGIWKSADAGATWVKKLDVQDAYDIAFHPTDPNKVFAAVGGGNSASGFYLSTDQGETWTQSNAGLPETGSMHRLQIDISQSHPNIIHAVIFDANTMSTKAYKSTDGGQIWVQISPGINLGGYSGGWYDQGFYDLCIAVDPVNPDLVYLGNVELHRTVNGSTYAPVRPYGNDLWGGLTHCDIHKLVFAPSNPNYFYIASDGGIYKSTDKGYSATSQNEGLSTLQFYRVASHPTDPQIIIGGMQDNSTAMTTDGGLTWDEVTGGDGMECLFNPGNPDTIYTSAQCGYFFRSVNGGATFNFLVNINGSWTTPLIMHPTNHKILYTASKSIHRTTTGGTPFQVIAFQVAPEFIVSLAMSPVEPDNMIFASGGNQIPVPGEQIVVKISTDGGYNWNDVTSNIPGEPRWITRVVCDPLDANTMYILRTGFSAGNKVWKTTNLGLNWANISGDLPDLPCSDLFIDPENTQHLYLANDIGVYHSANGGISWEYASQGVPYVPAIDFDYVKIGTDRYLRVGTHGRSIYQTLLPNYCLLNGITFNTQEQIDNFQVNYPGCTEVLGDIFIESNSITNLAGLNFLHSVAGNLTIMNTPNLSNLNGLNSLEAIGGYLYIIENASLSSLTGLEGLVSVGAWLQILHNDLLTNLLGLNNLQSVGGKLSIVYNDGIISLEGLNNLSSIGGDLAIAFSPAIISLTGLNSLTSIGGSLAVVQNPLIASLEGLGNISANSVTNLKIFINPELSTCDVQSICEYLASPNGTIEIHDNAPGCNSPEELEASCLTTVEEITTRNELTIIPNPSNDKITISSPAITRNTQLTIFNVSGEKVLERQLTDNETQIDIRILPRGIYFVRVQNEKMVEVGKMVKK